MRGVTALAVLLMPVLLAACGQNDTDPGPGGVTVGEARALDEAAAMLDSRRLPDSALEEPSAASAAGPSATMSAEPASN